MGKFASRVDFHGDGSDQKINVISLVGSLKNKWNLGLFKKIMNSLFIFAESAERFGQSQSHFADCFVRFIHSFGCDVGRADLVATLGVSHARPFKALTFRLGSRPDAVFSKDSINNQSSTPVLLAKLVNAIARKVLGDDYLGRQIFFIPRLGFFVGHEVKSLDKNYFEGDVYNFETTTNAYLACDFLASNCRCVAQPIVEW
jgi:hypothetical protein